MTAPILRMFRARGQGKEVEGVTAPEVSMWTPGAGTLGILEGSPHPNAARVYINWLLSKKGQKVWSVATGNNSRRTDVSPSNPKIFPKPELLDRYLRYDEAFEEIRRRLTGIARTLIR